MDDKKNLSESDIRLRYIDPAPQRKWDKSRILTEYTFTDGRVMVSGNQATRGAKKRADFVLFYKKILPLAIVEAKDNKRHPAAGLQQAMEDAEILDVPFAYSCNGDEFVERDMEAGTEKPIPFDDFPGPEELWRRFIAAKKISVDEEKIILEPYHYEQGARTPRYYQRAAINKTIEAVARGQKKNPAGHGHGHRQDLHGFSDSLATLEIRRAQENPLSGRPQYSGRSGHKTGF